MTMDQCYRGLPADPGCHPADPGCAPSTCAAPGCTEPAPLGCFASCGMNLPNCQQCATTSCECDPSTGAWTCQLICLDGFPLNLPCFHPM
jgi:hypothetical protein